MSESTESTTTNADNDQDQDRIEEHHDPDREVDSASPLVSMGLISPPSNEVASSGLSTEVSESPAAADDGSIRRTGRVRVPNKRLAEFDLEPSTTTVLAPPKKRPMSGVAQTSNYGTPSNHLVPRKKARDSDHQISLNSSSPPPIDMKPNVRRLEEESPLLVSKSVSNTLEHDQEAEADEQYEQQMVVGGGEDRMAVLDSIDTVQETINHVTGSHLREDNDQRFVSSVGDEGRNTQNSEENEHNSSVISGEEMDDANVVMISAVSTSRLQPQQHTNNNRLSVMSNPEISQSSPSTIVTNNTNISIHEYMTVGPNGDVMRQRGRPGPRINPHSVGDPNRRFGCHLCGQRFTHACHLKAHMRIHTGARPFMCAVCEKSFTMRGHLTYHMRIHSGEQPFECPLCDYKGKQSSHLELHMRQRHKQTHYACTMPGCTEVFTTLAKLAKHCHKAHDAIIDDQDHYDPMADLQMGGDDDLDEDNLDIMEPNTVSTGGRIILQKPQRLPCPYCGRTYANNNYLNRHVREAHEPICVQRILPGEDELVANLLKSLYISDDHYWKSEVNILDNDESQLVEVEEQHERQAAGGSNTPVTYTYRRPSRPTPVVRQPKKNQVIYVVQSEPQKLVSCPYCDRMFTSSSHLDVHFMQEHLPAANDVHQGGSHEQDGLHDQYVTVTEEGDTIDEGTINWCEPAIVGGSVVQEHRNTPNKESASTRVHSSTVSSSKLEKMPTPVLTTAGARKEFARQQHNNNMEQSEAAAFLAAALEEPNVADGQSDSGSNVNVMIERADRMDRKDTILMHKKGVPNTNTASGTQVLPRKVTRRAVPATQTHAGGAGNGNQLAMGVGDEEVDVV